MLYKWSYYRRSRQRVRFWTEFNMKFLGTLFIASAIVATCNGGYPKITAIFSDPNDYASTFLSGRYDANEQFSFSKNLSLDAVIVPTRAHGSSGVAATYGESYKILVEAADDLGDHGYREDVGVGYFTGNVSTGSSITVPIISMKNPEESLIVHPTRNGEVLRYVIYAEYGMMAMAEYPEFQNRTLEFLDIFSRKPDSFGFLVGIQYSHP